MHPFIQQTTFNNTPGEGLFPTKPKTINLAFWTAALLVVLMMAAAPVQAQSLEADPGFLLEYNTERLALNRNGMGVLLGWSLLNIGVGTAGHFTSSGRWQAFHQGNAAWNTVNLAIAGLSLWSLQGVDPGSFGLLETIQESEKFQKFLLPNIGLDVAYMTAGGWLWERGRRVGSARQEGFGQALVLQGAFLLVFDAVLWWQSLDLTQELYGTIMTDPNTGAQLLGITGQW